jgi:hypothetical protein
MAMKRKEEDIQPWILDLTKASFDTANRKFYERLGRPPTEWWELLAWGAAKLFYVEMIEAAVQQQSAKLAAYAPEMTRVRDRDDALDRLKQAALAHAASLDALRTLAYADTLEATSHELAAAVMAYAKVERSMMPYLTKKEET